MKAARYYLALIGLLLTLLTATPFMAKDQNAWYLPNSSFRSLSSALTVYFTSNDTGFIGGSYMFYRTVDGGLTWQKIDYDFYNEWPPATDRWSIVNIRFANAKIGYASGATNDVFILKTIDGGITWKNVAAHKEVRGGISV